MSISPQYPAVEAITALAFAVVVWVRGADDDLLLELPLVAALIALAVIDLHHRILPNKIVYPLAVLGLAAAALVDTSDLLEHLIAGTAAFVALLVVVLIHPAGMGVGDVKLAGVLGIYLGWSVAPSLLIAFFTGSVVGVAIMAREGAAARKKAVPFGVFLAIGGIAGVLVGPELVELYDERFLS